jgi:sugar phosphate isomerase/epimerase
MTLRRRASLATTRAMIPSVSTHLFVFDRLTREPLRWVAEAGFAHLEVWAARHHFDYQSPAAVDELGEWCAGLGLTVASLHLPFYLNFGRDDFQYIGFAHPDPAVRALMHEHTQRLVEVATQLGAGDLILHPVVTRRRDGSNLRPALDWLAPLCAARGITVQLENIMLPESRCGLLAGVCREYDEPLGICLDTGHAHVDGGLLCEIAAAGEHLQALHVHDNFGSADDHLPPGRGNIDWPATLSSVRLNAPNARLFTFELNGPAGPPATIETPCRESLEAVAAFWSTYGKDAE